MAALDFFPFRAVVFPGGLVFFAARGADDGGGGGGLLLGVTASAAAPAVAARSAFEKPVSDSGDPNRLAGLLGEPPTVCTSLSCSSSALASRSMPPGDPTAAPLHGDDLVEVGIV